MNKFFSKHWVNILGALVVCVGLAFLFGIQQSSLAADLSTGGGGLSISQGTGDTIISSSISKKSFGDTLLSMVNYFIGFLGFLATIAFIYAGVLWVVSGGNEEMITKAKKIMTYSALGILVVIMSFSIVRFITSSAGTEPPSCTPACAPSEYCDSTGTCQVMEQNPNPSFPGCKNHMDCVNDINYGVGYVCYPNYADRKNECVKSGATFVNPGAPNPGWGGCKSASECKTGEICSPNYILKKNECKSFSYIPDPTFPGCQSHSECVTCPTGKTKDSDECGYGHGYACLTDYTKKKNFCTRY